MTIIRGEATSSSNLRCKVTKLFLDNHSFSTAIQRKSKFPESASFFSETHICQKTSFLRKTMVERGADLGNKY